MSDSDDGDTRASGGDGGGGDSGVGGDGQDSGVGGGGGASGVGVGARDSGVDGAAVDAGGRAEDTDRLSHDGNVMLVAGMAGLVVAVVRTAAGGPASVVVLTAVGGAIGVGAAARELRADGRPEPPFAAHLAAGGFFLAAAAIGGLTRRWLAAIVLALLALMTLGPVYERVRDAREG